MASAKFIAQHVWDMLTERWTIWIWVVIAGLGVIALIAVVLSWFATCFKSCRRCYHVIFLKKCCNDRDRAVPVCNVDEKKKKVLRILSLLFLIVLIGLFSIVTTVFSVLIRWPLRDTTHGDPITIERRLQGVTHDWAPIRRSLETVYVSNLCVDVLASDKKMIKFFSNDLWILLLVLSIVPFISVIWVLISFLKLKKYDQDRVEPHPRIWTVNMALLFSWLGITGVIYLIAGAAGNAFAVDSWHHVGKKHEATVCYLLARKQVLWEKPIPWADQVDPTPDDSHCVTHSGYTGMRLYYGGNCYNVNLYGTIICVGWILVGICSLVGWVLAWKLWHYFRDLGESWSKRDHTSPTPMTVTKRPKGAGNYQQPETLLLAAAEGDMATLDRCIEAQKAAGNNPNDTADEFNNRGLHYAAYKNNIGAIERLIKAGCDPDERNDYGYTPLGVAANEGKVEAVRYLMECGAKPDIQDNFGDTPIHSAARADDLDVLKAIIEFDQSQVDTRNREDESPIQVAEFHKRERARAFLEPLSPSHHHQHPQHQQHHQPQHSSDSLPPPEF